MAMTPADIQALSSAITQALRMSGGMQGPPHRWDPIASRINQDGPPGERAHEMRMSKIYEDNNKLLKELKAALSTNTRSVDDLKRYSDIQKKTMDKALESNKDIDKATQQLVKQLQRQLSSQDAQTQQLNRVAGNFKDLKGVLAFGDLTKNIAELSKALDANSDATAQEISELVSVIERSIKVNNPNSKGIEDLDPELKKMTRLLDRIANSTRAATAADVANGRASAIGDRLRDDDRTKRLLNQLRNDPKRRPALERLRDTAIIGQRRVIEGNTAAIRDNTGVVGTARQRLGDWVIGVAKATFVLDQLASAGKQLISTIKTAGGTGTEKGLGAILSRDISTFLHGVNPDVMQDIQVKGARARTGFGKDDFDQSIKGSIANLFAITYDRNEAAKMHEATLSTLFKSGIGPENTKTAAASKDLRDSFLKLQAMTGMTGEQMATLNNEIASDTQFRQGLMTLTQKERAATIVGITKMFEENAQRNISIEQTKEMIKTQQALSDAHSPKTRIKNAAKLRALGGAIGIDTNDAAELVLASGNDQLMQKRLMGRGMSRDQAAAHVKNARMTQERVGTLAEQDLGDNGARGLAMEALLGNTGTKDWALSAGQTLNIAGKLQKEAADTMMAAALKMAETSNSQPIANAADYIKNMFSTMTGKLVAAAAGTIGLYASKDFIKNYTKNKLSSLLQWAKGGRPGAVPNGVVGNPTAVRSGPGMGRPIGPGTGEAIASGVASTANGVIGSPRSIVTAPGMGRPMGLVGIGGGAANASTLANAPPGMGVMGTIANAGKAANAASITPGIGSRAIGIASRSATPIAAAIALGSAAAVLADKRNNTQQKAAGVGKAAGMFGGGWAGATAGATVGSLIPGLGTGVGALVGLGLGLLGGVGGSMFGGWTGEKLGSAAGGLFNGKPQATGIASSPVSPSISPAVNTPGKEQASVLQNQKSLSGNNGMKTDEQLKAEAAKAVHDLNAQRSMDQMNVTLGQILKALQDQTEDLNDGTQKTLSAQDRLRRAIKTGGFSGATPADGAANAYKAS